jgi:hypothetical protein
MLSVRNVRILSTAGIALGTGAIGYAAGAIITAKRLNARFISEVDELVDDLQKNFDAQFAARLEYLGVDPANGVVQDRNVPLVQGEKIDFADPDVINAGAAKVADLLNKPEVLTTEEAAAFNGEDEQIVSERRIELKNPIEIKDENIFDKDEPQLSDWEKELLLRSDLQNANKPYILSTYEFYTGPDKDDYENITITYFAGDDTLADDAEHIVSDVENMIGRANLTKFGLGSDDPNVLYVRNEDRKVDWEISLDPRGYADVVVGLQGEAYELPKQPLRKMREVDGN